MAYCGGRTVTRAVHCPHGCGATISQASRGGRGRAASGPGVERPVAASCRSPCSRTTNCRRGVACSQAGASRRGTFSRQLACRAAASPQDWWGRAARDSTGPRCSGSSRPRPRGALRRASVANPPRRRTGSSRSVTPPLARGVAGTVPRASAVPTLAPAPTARPPACILVPDANILLDHPQLGRWRADGTDLTVLVLERIAQELHGLGKPRHGRHRRRGAPPWRWPRVRRAVRARHRHAARRAWRSCAARTPRRRRTRTLVAEGAAARGRHPQAAVAVVSRDVACGSAARGRALYSCWCAAVSTTPGWRGRCARPWRRTAADARQRRGAACARHALLGRVACAATESLFLKMGRSGLVASGMGRQKHYTTHLDDDEWAILGPFLAPRCGGKAARATDRAAGDRQRDLLRPAPAASGGSARGLPALSGTRCTATSRSGGTTGPGRG